MSAVVLNLETKLKQSDQTIARQNEIISIMSKKQDIANNLIMTIFSLSELPASVREQIHSAQTDYNGLDAMLQLAGQVVEVVKKAEENQEQPGIVGETTNDQAAEVDSHKPALL